MKLFDIIQRSLRNLASAKVRTILTALAIAVGGFTLTLTLGAGNGVREYTDKLINSNFDPAELIVGRDPEISNDGSPLNKPKEYDESISSIQLGGTGGSLQVKQLTRTDIEELQKMPFVEQVRENYQIQMQFITAEGQKRFTGSLEVFNPSQKPEIVAGGVDEQGRLGERRVFIPEDYLSVLNLGSPEEAVGKIVLVNVAQPFSQETAEQLIAQAQSGALNNQQSNNTNNLKPADQTVSLRIVGVTKRSPTSLNMGSLPIIISPEDARELYDFTSKGTPNYDKFLLAFVKVKNGQDPAVLAQAKSELEKKGFQVQSAKEIQQTITQFVDILQTLVAVFGIITLVAATFGIINTQYISVLERTREIGLMKALGMRSRDVRRIFVLEASWIGFLGGLIGSIGAVVTGLLLNPVITKQLDLGDASLIKFQMSQIIILLAVLMLVGALAGYLPARKAAKMNPIEALRTE